jgi:hypothetical protein
MTLGLSALQDGNRVASGDPAEPPRKRRRCWKEQEPLAPELALHKPQAHDVTSTVCSGRDVVSDIAVTKNPAANIPGPSKPPLHAGDAPSVVPTVRVQNSGPSDVPDVSGEDMFEDKVDRTNPRVSSII